MNIIGTAGVLDMNAVRAKADEVRAKLEAAGVRKPDAVFGSSIDGPNISLVWQDARSRTELVFDGSEKPQLIEVGDGPWDQRIGNVLGVRDVLRGSSK